MHMRMRVWLYAFMYSLRDVYACIWVCMPVHKKMYTYMYVCEKNRKSTANCESGMTALSVQHAHYPTYRKPEL